MMATATSEEERNEGEVNAVCTYIYAQRTVAVGVAAWRCPPPPAHGLAQRRHPDRLTALDLEEKEMKETTM